MFLEETFWREKNIIFSNQFKLMSGKNWVGNEEQNFFIRSYRSKISVWSNVEVYVKKPSEGKCEVSREKTQWGRMEHCNSDLIKWPSYALALQVDELKEIDLEGWTSCLNYKEGKPSKEEELKSDLNSARYELQFVSGQKFSNTFLPLY